MSYEWYFIKVIFACYLTVLFLAEASENASDGI